MSLLAKVPHLISISSRCMITRATHARLLHHSTPLLGAHDAQFEEAKQRLNSLKEDPGNQTKLQIYALFKQATQGKCNQKKPGMIDFVGKAKWEAWNSLGDLSQDAAQEQYIQVVDGLVAAEQGDSAQEDSSASTPAGSYKTLKVTTENKMCTIMLNRPQKKNAITVEMYEELIQAFTEVGKDKNVTLAVLTGAGDFYCSGNDLSNFLDIPEGGIAVKAADGAKLLQRFIQSFIDFPKPLLAVINGPAVGVSVTTLGLCDAVYATDSATFHTPFTALGQSAEGCSSVVFPKLMGTGKANEMLLFNKKLSAQEACDRGLVTEVFPNHTFEQDVWARVKQYAQLPPQSMQEGKQLVRGLSREELERANVAECQLLEKLWQGQECMEAVMAFFSKK